MSEASHRSWVVGGGEMGARMRAFDWSETPLGPLDRWPQSLRSAVSICLGSRFPIVIYWGPEFVVLYNDAYAQILAGKHPQALGQRCREVWAEIWDVIGPMLEGVVANSEATWSDNQLLVLQRHGFPEECYFSFSFSPVRSEDDSIGGVFTAVIEHTQRVIGERRVVALRDLGARATEAKTAAEACAIAAQTLSEHGKDIPFALLYLIEDTGAQARLAAAAGVAADGPSNPTVVELKVANADGGPWPLAVAARTEVIEVVENLSGRLGMAVPPGPWPDAPRDAVIVPIRSNVPHQLAGFLVAGVSARLKLDALYRSYYELVATQIATAIANARSHQEERKRAEALAEIDRAKTAFFSNVSHEFRTPLTLMLGPVEDLLVKSHGELTPASKAQLDVVHRNSLRLLKLVNTMLDFSRIEAGRIQANYEPVDLATYTSELASVFRAAIERAGMRLVVNCPPLSAPVYVDRDMWENIVLNLLSNAFKFTHDGEIEVRLEGQGNEVQLTVRDTGVGIPDAEMPHVFERFHRVKDARGRTHEGTGIGLALVQELVRLHGGSVRVESLLDRGSRFTVTVPLGKAHLDPRHVHRPPNRATTRAGAQSYVEEALRWLPEDDQQVEQTWLAALRSSALPADTMPAVPGGARPRIVWADDNADMRDYVARLLRERFEVEAVADGQAALDAARAKTPDLVLSDVMMPRLDGLGLLRELRADPRLSTIPIILLSARAAEETRVEGVQAGADDYLIKPFSARELMARVASHIRMAAFRREATAALRESEARFRHMADHAPVMVWVTGPDAACTFLSHSWYEFTGQTADTALGFGWLDSVHSEDRDAARETFVAANAKREAFRLEYRLRRKDGEYRWTIDAAGPRFSDTGEFLGYIGSVIDITERKEAEQTQQLLLAELNHRVKNTLATVQAVAQHTVRQTRDPVDFAASFAGRIQSLARVHSMLTDTTWQSADLRELIRDQLLQGPVDETRLTAWGPSVSLPAQMALLLALMIHELGTNSNKHGALSRPDGWVTISWTVEDGALRLRWEERGAPVRAPTKRGFGMTLIEQSAKGQGGDARMSVEADGLVWNVTMPLPRPPSGGPGTKKPTVAGLLDSTPARRAPRLADQLSAKMAGKRFLVVEDEPLLALDLATGLQEMGAEVAGRVGTKSEALRIIESTSLDAALLDANLHGNPVDEIAAALTRRNVPFVFVTGYGRDSLPRAFAKAAMLAKPFSPQQLREAVMQLIDRAADVVRLKS